jgi:hypothetical protein
MGVIDIGTVLKHFDDTVDERDLTVKDYGIKFITADGRLRTMRARKNIKNPKRQLNKSPQERGRVMYNLQRHGTMLVHDLAIDKPRSVKVSTICFFADHNSTEFHRVFH